MELTLEGRSIIPSLERNAQLVHSPVSESRLADSSKRQAHEDSHSLTKAEAGDDTSNMAQIECVRIQGSYLAPSYVLLG